MKDIDFFVWLPYKYTMSMTIAFALQPFIYGSCSQVLWNPFKHFQKRFTTCVSYLCMFTNMHFNFCFPCGQKTSCACQKVSDIGQKQNLKSLAHWGMANLQRYWERRMILFVSWEIAGREVFLLHVRDKEKPLLDAAATCGF